MSGDGVHDVAEGSAGELRVAGTEACAACLRRAWLIGALAPYLERSGVSARGRRLTGLLARSNEELVEAVAPRHAGRLFDELEGIETEEMRAAIEAADCWSTCRHCEDYPAGLRDLGDGPAALFGRGDRDHLAALEVGRSVTLVGARRASAYGIGVARDLGRELAMAGLTVISGMALGIDGAAHTGALEAGLSCAVLGGGVDQAYPARHRGIYARHCERGLLLSELPVGSDTRRWMFPARNRLMAAMSGMTVVVEARRRSGSLITAKMAQELGRDLGAVPGPVTSTVSQGSNDLLASGACVVRDAQDVLDAMLGVGQAHISQGPPLDPELQEALEAFERSEGELDDFVAALPPGSEPPAIVLTRLELLGYLRCSELGVWTRTTLKPPERSLSPGSG